jgi:hypothetical protein
MISSDIITWLSLVNNDYQGMPPSEDAAMSEGLAEETKAEWDHKGRALISQYPANLHNEF